MQNKRAVLALEDGSLFYGYSVGAEKYSVGEIVFNTSMTGYQEIITDPSYANQLVTLTYPHIGNTGINQEDNQHSQPCLHGLITRNMTNQPSNWRSKESLPHFLKKHNITAISGIDTRRLTQLLRKKGAMLGCIAPENTLNVSEAQQCARHCPPIQGLDLAKKVTTSTTYCYPKNASINTSAYHVVAYDFGIKESILKMLSLKNCSMTVVPATTSAEDVLALKPQGIFLSNGPGDPAACQYAIQAVKKLLKSHIPIFGICLGYQLLALASGAKTIKMKFGHHGANHPVQELKNNRVIITSQNHSFAVDKKSLPPCLKVTHSSLFDSSLQGITRLDVPAFGFQGHPEANPGPQDGFLLFDDFISMMDQSMK